MFCVKCVLKGQNIHWKGERNEFNKIMSTFKIWLRQLFSAVLCINIYLSIAPIILICLTMGKNVINKIMQNLFIIFAD